MVAAMWDDVLQFERVVHGTPAFSRLVRQSGAESWQIQRKTMTRAPIVCVVLGVLCVAAMFAFERTSKKIPKPN